MCVCGNDGTKHGSKWGERRSAGNLSHTCLSALILFVQELMHKSVDVFRLTTRLPLSRKSIAKGLLLFYILISLPWFMSLFGHALRFSPRTITEFNLPTVASHTAHSFGPGTLCRDSDPLIFPNNQMRAIERLDTPPHEYGMCRTHRTNIFTRGRVICICNDTNTHK